MCPPSGELGFVGYDLAHNQELDRLVAQLGPKLCLWPQGDCLSDEIQTLTATGRRARKADDLDRLDQTLLHCGMFSTIGVLGLLQGFLLFAERVNRLIALVNN